MDLAPTALTENHVTRYFFSLKDQASTADEKAFSEKLGETQSELSDIQGVQNSIAPDFYSYSTHRKELKSVHSIWSESIRSLLPRLTKCALMIKSLYDELPFLPACLIKKNLQKVCLLALSFESTEAKVTQLSTLLSSQLYAESIILYKGTVENFPQKDSPPKITTQSGDLNYLDEYLRNEIKRVHEELQHCFPSHLQKNRRNLTEDIPLIGKRLNEVLVQQNQDPEDLLLTEAISQHIKFLSISDPITKNKINTDFTQSLQKTYQEAQSIELRSDLSFCSGKLGGLESWAARAGNPLVVPFINDLEKIAQRLQGLKESIEEILLQTYQGNASSIPDTDYQNFFTPIFSISLSISEQLLTISRSSIYPLLQTKQVHTALYYAARLFAYTKEIHFLLDHFTKKLADDNNKIIIKALDNSYRFLAAFEEMTNVDENGDTVSTLVDNIKSLFVSQVGPQSLQQAVSNDKKIKNLFFAARSIGTALDLHNRKKICLSPFNLTIVTCLETVITRIGTQLLSKLSENSESTWRQIVCKSLTGATREVRSNLSISIQEYIEKEITQWLFFSQNPTHLQLDMFLETLNKTTRHFYFLEKRCAEDLEFKEIYQSFQNTYPTEIISIFCNMFHLLHQEEYFQANNNPYIFASSKIIALLYQVKELEDVNKEFEHLIRYVETTLQKKIPYSVNPAAEPETTEEQSDHLFHLLSKALWLGNGPKQQEAFDLVKKHFQSYKKEELLFHLDEREALNYLISLFALNQACLRQNLSLFESFVVEKTIEVFREYGFLLPIELIRLCLELEKGFI